MRNLQFGEQLLWALVDDKNRIHSTHKDKYQLLKFVVDESISKRNIKTFKVGHVFHITRNEGWESSGHYAVHNKKTKTYTLRRVFYQVKLHETSN